MKFWTALIAGVLLVASMQAEAARRLGGGNSAGRQSGNVTQREAARPATPSNTAPANAAPGATPGAAPGAAPGAPAATPQPATATGQRPAGATPPAAPSRPWAGILGGLAAGLGLAWLAHSLGMGAGFGQFLLIALVGLAVVMVVMFFLRRRAPQRMAYAGAGSADPEASASVPQYNPDKVGNDSSARPWESPSTHFEPAAPAPESASAGGLRIGSGLAGGNWSIPAGFDAEGFIDAAKRNFVALQDAWDRSDISALRAMMTDEMVTEIRNQLAERDAHRGSGPNQTDVVLLEAQLLGIEDLGDGYMASVEFTGLIREEPSAGPSPFREVWNMTKPKDGRSGWLVAGVQALQ